jgi:hypothetical protein
MINSVIIRIKKTTTVFEGWSLWNGWKEFTVYDSHSLVHGIDCNFACYYEGGDDET